MSEKNHQLDFLIDKKLYSSPNNKLKTPPQVKLIICSGVFYCQNIQTGAASGSSRRFY